MTPLRTRTFTAVGTLVLLGGLTACGNDSGQTAAVHQVKAGDDSCQVNDTSLEAGQHAFKIENVGSDVTEVYVYGKDGEEFTKIMGERENIGPGTSQTLQVDLAAGKYQVACKPGMTGDGIRTALSVTGEGGATQAAKESYDRELEFEVAEDGTVERPAQLTATTGEKVEFKLENNADAEYYLEVLAPDGSEIGEGEAPGGKDAEFVAEFADGGAYQIKVFSDGQEDRATILQLRVKD